MRFSIYRKMVLGFAIVISIVIAAQAYTLFELHALSDEAQTTLTLEVQSLDLSKRLRSLLDDEDSYARKYLITGDRSYYKLFQESVSEFQKVLASLVMTEAKRSDLLHQVAERHHSFSSSVPAFDEADRKTLAPLQASDQEERQEQIDFIDRSLKGLIRINQLSIDSAMSTFVDATQRATLVTSALTLLTIFVASLAAWIIARTVTRPLRRVVAATQEIARGRFEPIEVRSRDETALLAQAINDMGLQLKKANEAKADLMHEIIHELRNPLQIIFFARNILADQELGNINGKQLEMLELIGSNADKLMNFTTQFLDLAKADAGMMEYHRSPVDVGSIVARAVDEARTLARSKNIAVKLLAEPLPQTYADGDKLAQVFANLLSNAVKYTESGGSVAVAAFCIDQKVYVAVKDSGIGIDADDLPKLFTKFYRASNSETTHAAGTGIGLALVKTIIEAHGGSISVSSKLGEGSTFLVELPLALSAESAAIGSPAAA
ncbi:MAG TPA: ATP-binding protein [Verrucomicrobiae bacterium]|nr:ATP-binding protein [Verrucomicrobiae bacterium]